MWSPSRSQLQGDPAWTPDGQSITSAANVDGTPHLFRIALERATGRRSFRITALDPVWSPAGDFLVYSGADIGTTFPVKAVTAAGGAYPTPNLTLTRGARRLRFLHGQRALVVMRGDIEHKNLWLIDLDTGAERQLTNLPRPTSTFAISMSPPMAARSSSSACRNTPTSSSSISRRGVIETTASADT